jgi:hypothetical protein
MSEAVPPLPYTSSLSGAKVITRTNFPLVSHFTYRFLQLLRLQEFGKKKPFPKLDVFHVRTGPFVHLVINESNKVLITKS